jgi:acyl transferase domain-containing protein/NADPH:quinone reductase-like Zn-dependent oxidoreductase/NAD(P)-dependent dehydrogenase (short-subunit alcohol dehydrogenase family)/acyl carrier protein
LSKSQDDLFRELLLEKYEPIAIVGVGLRFPGGSRTPEEFAEFLRTGGCGTGPVPADRWDVDHYYSAEPAVKGRISTTGGGFVDAIDQFDAAFFNISPKEAQFIDPQQRMTLETAWEALEDAGIDPTQLRGSNGGVYIGISCTDYSIEAAGLADEDLETGVGTGFSHSATPGRLSYLLGWRGPSVAVDTACSSSIVALDLAVTGLRRRDCDIAVCGGVNAIHHPRNHIVFCQAGMLSPDGRCKTFDDSADGYARSEGCGAIVLKRYSDAKRAGDRILALVRGTAVRQDGESGGLTVPNSVAQEAVMHAALRSASLEPADISYVEAHGTGTSLGDPIEMRSIASVFAESHTCDAPVAVASLKTNIGHMEAAAGIGGVIKTALQLRDARFYPHLHLETPSRHIPWSKYPVAVPTENVPWQAPVRRAIVNSFGFAGTIASAVLEQAPGGPAALAAPGADGGAGADEVFVLSAKSEKALHTQAERYRAFVKANPELPLRDIAYSAAVGRAHFDHRIAGVVSDSEALAALLDGPLDAVAGPPPKICMLFTGQGSQYAGMGRSLYQRHPVFREHLDACDRLFEPYLGRSIRDMILGEAAGPAEIDQTRYTQPALFALEYATAQLWMSWGVEPSILMGHSIGEVVAATVAKLFSLPDAVRLVAARSRLMQSVSAPGGMISVQANMNVVAPLLKGYQDVAFAAVNTPQLCVVSGGNDSLAEVAAKLTEQGISNRALVVSHAFHSPLMAEVFAEFAEAIADLEVREPDCTLVSNVTGEVAPFELMATPEYWVRHIGSPVNFAAGMRAVAGRGSHLFLEVGPSSTLIGLGRRCVNAAEHTWIASMRPDDEAGIVLKRSVAEAYRAGAQVSWPRYYRGAEASRVTLPTYAFDRRSYWLPDSAGGRSGTQVAAQHPLLGAEVSDTQDREAGLRLFSATVNPDRPGYLRDHVVLGQTVVPATAYVELLLAVQDAVFGETGRPIHDLTIHEALIVSDDYDVEVLTRLRLTAGDCAEVEVASRVVGWDEAIERLHVTARIGTADGLLPEIAETRDGLLAAAARPGPAVDQPVDELYAAFDDIGLTYGAEFQRIQALRLEGDGVVSATLRGHQTGVAEFLPPFLPDNMGQSAGALLGFDNSYLPVRMGTMQFLRKPKGTVLRSLLRITTEEDERGERSEDLMLLDDDRPVVIVRGLGVRRVVATVDEQRRLFHQPRWVKRSLVRKAGAQPRDVIVVHRTADQCAGFTDRLPAASLEVRYAADASAAGALLEERWPTDVCWFWKPSRDAAATAGSLRAECERNYRDLLALLGTLREHGFGPDQRLWLVTDRAQLLPEDQAGPERSFAAATLWGFGRSLWSENPGWRVTLVDLADDDAPLLDECLAAEAEEFQVAYRAGKRHVLRIFPSGQAGRTDDNFELTVPDSGELADIRPVVVSDDVPQGAEIQVRMHAAGLNFKDVLNALGMLKRHAEDSGAAYHPLPLGFEGAGTVVAAGPDAQFGIGEDVVLSHSGCLRKRVTVPSVMAVSKPANVSFAEAAGLATAYVTAYYALHTLAKIKAGDKVLIHAAAGGVGQAAVALAKLAGAEVFATASPAKHSFLRAQGIENVFNSRTLDFAEQIRTQTGDTGVDIVLNSLNGDFIPASIGTLASAGRFVELGKIGIWSPEQARSARPDVEYFNFDLSEFPEREYQQINREILQTVAGLLADGSIAPVTTSSYSLDEIEEAFGVLSRGANIGKVVIDLQERALIGSDPELVLGANETFLITGGLGALGLITAQRLVAGGARRLAFVSRRGADDPAAGTLRAKLDPDVDVVFLRGDVADQADVERIIAEMRKAGHQLAGIVHAAGVLADGPVSTMTWEQIDQVFQAKVYGTWALHQAARQQESVRFFVGYSSMSSVLGTPGQANYAAGNAFIDAVMSWREARGEPGLAVGWGPWAEVGMAASLNAQLIKGIEGQGVRFIKPRAGSRALGKLLGQPLGHVLVGEIDWNRFVAQRTAGNALYSRVARGQAAQEAAVDLEALIALPRTERQTTINAAVRARIAVLLHFDGIEQISPHAKFLELGVDSLTAVEMKNGLESMFRISLPSSAVFDYPTIAQLASYIDEQVAPVAQAEPTAEDEIWSLKVLADEDIDAELASLRGM